MSKDRSKFSSFGKEQKIFEDWRNYLHDEDLQIKLISEQEQLGGVYAPQARKARQSLDAISNVAGLPVDPDDSPQKRDPRPVEDLDTPDTGPAPMPETEPGPWEPAPMPETEPGPWEPAPMPQPKPRAPAGPWGPPARERTPAAVFDPETAGRTPTMMERIIREELEAVLAEQQGLSLGGPGGGPGGGLGALAGLANHPFAGWGQPQKQPWEIDPELARALFPRGLANPFIPGAGSDDPAYAATYPERDAAMPVAPGARDAGANPLGFGADQTRGRQQQPGGAPAAGMPGQGQHDWENQLRNRNWENFQPEVREYSPEPKTTRHKDTKEHSWHHDEPWKETKHSWHKEGPLPRDADLWGSLQKAQKQMGPKGSGKKMNRQQMQDFVNAWISPEDTE